MAILYCRPRVTRSLYDRTTNLWTTYSNALSVPRAGSTAAVVGSLVVVGGGAHDTVPSAAVDTWSLVTNQWTALTPSLSPVNPFGPSFSGH